MNRSRLVSVGQAVGRRWPALAVATVAASVPLVSFAASPTSFPDGIIAGRSFFTNGILVSSPSAGGQGIAVTGAAVGVRANSPGGTAINATNGQSHNVIGVDASGDALGVRVNATGSSGIGVKASSATGLGAELSGGQAPLRLVPAAASGAPTSGVHKRGELYVDNQGQLFLCVADSVGGNAGTWKHVHLDNN